MDAWRMQQLHVVEYFYVRKCFSWPATCNPWYPDQAVDVGVKHSKRTDNVKGESCGESRGSFWKNGWQHMFFGKCMRMGMEMGFRKSKHNGCSFSMLDWEHFQQILGGIWITHLAAAGVLIAMKLPHDVMLWYCWWKKSCTSWYTVVNIHYLRGFIHPRWCRISSINSMCLFFFWRWFCDDCDTPATWLLRCFRHVLGNTTAVNQKKSCGRWRFLQWWLAILSPKSWRMAMWRLNCKHIPWRCW